MKVHTFGNTSSPAVTNYALRKTAEVGEAKFGSGAKSFVDNNCYVDDGLHSASDSTTAIGRFATSHSGHASHYKPSPAQNCLKSC